MTLLSALGGGLFIIPLVLLLTSLWSFYRGYKQWKSGSGGYVGNPPRWVDNDEKVPYFSVGATIFGIILLAAAIGSFIWMQIEK